MFCEKRPPAEAAIGFAKCVMQARAALVDPDPRWTMRELRSLVRAYDSVSISLRK